MKHEYGHEGWKLDTKKKNIKILVKDNNIFIKDMKKSEIIYLVKRILADTLILGHGFPDCPGKCDYYIREFIHKIMNSKNINKKFSKFNTEITVLGESFYYSNSHISELFTYKYDIIEGDINYSDFSFEINEDDYYNPLLNIKKDYKHFDFIITDSDICYNFKLGKDYINQFMLNIYLALYQIYRKKARRKNIKNQFINTVISNLDDYTKELIESEYYHSQDVIDHNNDCYYDDITDDSYIHRDIISTYIWDMWR